jgi:type I restriction enzyme M protein
MKSDGRSLDDKRNELTLLNGSRDFGDLHTIITEYNNKQKNTNRELTHFIIPKSEIIANEYDLSISKYKTEVYDEIIYDEPNVILEKLSLIESDIVNSIEELKAIL